MRWRRLPADRTDLVSNRSDGATCLVNGVFTTAPATFQLIRSGISYAGLLSTFELSGSSGLLDELLVQLPQEIAQTLAGDGTPATLAADWSALLAEFAPNLAADALSGL